MVVAQVMADIGMRASIGQVSPCGRDLCVGTIDMSIEAKLIVAGCVLAIIVPMMVVVIRRIVKGQPFENRGTGTMMPPLPPSIDIDGG